jgi:hypothetical protein
MKHQYLYSYKAVGLRAFLYTLILRFSAGRKKNQNKIKAVLHKNIIKIQYFDVKGINNLHD